MSFVRSLRPKCAVELGVIEAILAKGKPLSPPAEKLGNLGRLMQLLVRMGFFASDEDCCGEVTNGATR